MNFNKRMLALAMALLGVLGCLAGCGAGTEPILEATQATAANAKGRYVEQAIALPESQYELDMVMLSTGQLRVALMDESGSAVICTTDAQREDWEATQPLPEEIPASGDVESLALSPDGTVFCSTVQAEEGSYQYHFWVIDPTGEFREIPITYPELSTEEGFLVPACDFTDSGRLLVQFYFQDVREVDLTTGELSETRNELEPSVRTFCCAGEDIYLIGYNGLSVFRQDAAQALEGVLEEQLASSLQATEGTNPKLTFWENPEGYLIFTTHDGLYSYVPGGSVTEELVSGARTSLGDPSFCPRALTGTADGSFYVLGSSSEGTALYHYVYDPDMPTTPETQLRIYSLYEDYDLRQMISQYQKSHPEVSVDLEIGLTGEDGVTQADAIRTLNTQILAGDGPDLVCLDGFSLNTYLEKGLLADLTEVLSQAEPTLEQVTTCYAADGKLCAVPTTFALPAIYGPADIVSQIHDLDSLVAAATQAKAEYPQQKSVLSGIVPPYLADVFYDSCSAAWVNPDGTLDGETLAAYYAGMQALFALDEDYRQTIVEELGVSDLESMFPYTPGDYTGMTGAMTVCMGTEILTAGTLEGMNHWAMVLAGDEALEDYETAVLNVQASHVFLPRRIMGILTTCAQQEEAARFLMFMLSQEVQANSLSTGFPVNQAVFDQEIAEDRTLDTGFTSSDGEGNVLSFQAQYPDAARRQALKTWVAELTTPASTDRTIRTMVMEQMVPCLYGEITPQQAADQALQALNLYLSE